MIPLSSNRNAAGAKWLVLPVVLAVALLTVFWPRPRIHQAGNTSRQALRSELVLRDGRLYPAGDSNVFSGAMVERYPDGTLRSRSTVLDGLLDGLSEGWFTNGQLQVTEHFQRGISHGRRTKWHRGGGKLSEANIVKGQFDGPFRKWHENGRLSESVQFTNGQPAGISLAYFPSGFLKARARLEAGKVVEQGFWKDGESDEKLLAQGRTP
jgi:antitoxin component YwqK of YwqJK toxin-antitoxin module